jgi:DNA uptake protein ComE-like DNA-binding protein
MNRNNPRAFDLNSINESDLRKMPMIGEVRAQRILENRPFEDWDDLKYKVPGISNRMVQDLREGGVFIKHK